MGKGGVFIAKATKLRLLNDIYSIPKEEECRNLVLLHTNFNKKLLPAHFECKKLLTLVQAIAFEPLDFFYESL